MWHELAHLPSPARTSPGPHQDRRQPARPVSPAAPSFTPLLPPVAKAGRGCRVRCRATATMNGQQVWIDVVSRSARPRTLPSRVSASSQPSRAPKTAVTAAEPQALRISGRGPARRAAKAGHTPIVPVGGAHRGRSGSGRRSGFGRSGGDEPSITPRALTGKIGAPGASEVGDVIVVLPRTVSLRGVYRHHPRGVCQGVTSVAGGVSARHAVPLLRWRLHSTCARP